MPTSQAAFASSPAERDRLAALQSQVNNEAAGRVREFLDKQRTHAADCWGWGPKHYECAVGQIGRDEALLRQALEALELRCGTHADERKELIPALRKRLGEGAALKQEKDQ